MVIAPARRAGDTGSIPGPGENFSLKLLKKILMGCMEMNLIRDIYMLHTVPDRKILSPYIKLAKVN